MAPIVDLLPLFLGAAAVVAVQASPTTQAGQAVEERTLPLQVMALGLQDKDSPVVADLMSAAPLPLAAEVAAQTLRGPTVLQVAAALVALVCRVQSAALRSLVEAAAAGATLLAGVVLLAAEAAALEP